MSEYKPSEQERMNVERIRRQYIARVDNKFEQLRDLDNKVKLPGKVVAGILGITGTLVMGGGMSMIMVWHDMQAGLCVSIPGMLAAIFAYPAYTWITNRRKKKYAPEIIRLSDDLIAE